MDYIGNTTTKVYDGINRLVEERDADNKIKQQILYNDADAQSSSYDALHNRIQYLYDKNLRQIGTIDAEGYITSSTYDSRGNVKTKTDANGNTTTYKYDGENHLISVTDALGNVTSYTYDTAGNQASQTDGNGNTTTYKYNAANLITSKIDPNGSGVAGRTESYTYYANGLKATKTDRNGVTTSYTYDVLGKLTKEDAGDEVQNYTYDANGNLLTMADATGTTTRTYDALDRNTSKTVPDIGKSIYEYDLTADAAGYHSERTTDPKGNVTLNTYDKNDRLSSVKVGDETTAYEYYDNGSRSKVIYPDNTTESYTYDKKNQVISLINKKSDGTVISSYQYTYDGAGNQLTKTEEKGTTTYTYDNMNRLSTVSEPGGKTTSYTYDAAGNRKTEKVQEGMVYGETIYNYNSQNRLISTTSTDDSNIRYTYDYNGNLVSKTAAIIKPISTDNLTADDLPDFNLIIKHGSDNGTGSGSLTRYTYDRYNRLSSMKSDSTTATYQYNAQGYRVEKSVNGKDTKYLYDADKVVLETDASGNQKAFQAYGSSLLYRTVSADMDHSAQSYFYLYNAHGDVTSLIDTVGSIAATYDYDTFGNLLSKTGSADNYIRFAGYQQDDESGLYYLNARYYDSAIARFITEDSYTGQQNDPLSLNLYTYCSNNPIIYTDPSGHREMFEGSGQKDPNAELFKNLNDLYDLAIKYTKGNVTKANQLVLQYVRHDFYDGSDWNYVAGKIDDKFINYVDKSNKTLTNFFDDRVNMTDPKTGKKIDFTHMAATLNANIYNSKGIKAKLVGEDNINNLAGWAGDLQTFIKDAQINTNYSNNYKKIYKYTLKVLGSNSKPSTFNMADLLADVDAVNIATNSAKNTSIVDTIQNYYSSDDQLSYRYTNFVKNLTGETNESSFESLVDNYTDKYFCPPIKWPILKKVTVKSNQSRAIAKAFAEIIFKNVEKENKS